MIMPGRTVQPMTNGDVVKKFYAAWAEGSIVELFCTVREDIDLCAAMAFGLPMGGRCRGRAQLEGFFRSLREGVRVTRFEMTEVIERGDVVVVLGGLEGAVKQSGRTFATSFAHVFVVEKGRIARVRGFFDRGVMEEALVALRASGRAGVTTSRHAA